MRSSPAAALRRAVAAAAAAAATSPPPPPASMAAAVATQLLQQHHPQYHHHYYHHDLHQQLVLQRLWPAQRQRLAGVCSSARALAPAPGSSSSSSSSMPATSGGSGPQEQQPPAQPQPQSAPSASSSLDAAEAAKFAALADEWWDASGRGPFAPLHALNDARVAFLRQGLCALRGLPRGSAEPLRGLRVLDVGAGGGLLSERLARLGADVHGIDVSREGVAAAAAHAAGDPLLAARIRYEQVTLEEVVARSSGSSRNSGGGGYDVVVASEVIEHVRHPAAFVASLADAAAPGGHVAVTTLNRTPAAFALAIAGAEYALGVVPRGTHDWGRFLTPSELAMMARDAGLELALLAGMVLAPPALLPFGGAGGGGGNGGAFVLSPDLSVNYAALLAKPGAAAAAAAAA